MYRKSILIFTTANDTSSDEIINWLLSFETKILIYRINDTDDIKINISDDYIVIVHKGKGIEINKKFIVY